MVPYRYLYCGPFLSSIYESSCIPHFELTVLWFCVFSDAEHECTRIQKFDPLSTVTIRKV